MKGIKIEMNSDYGFERFILKVIRKYNMPQNQILPKITERPNPGVLSCIYIGRTASEKEVEKYVRQYYREKGLLEHIIKMHTV